MIETAHGTGLFQRGETQVLNVLTLGMPKMDQLLDTLGIENKKRYMHHYNMPPYSNGETGRMGGTKRREVGHGLLAERALLPVVPSLEEWPYALRVVSEVLSSNGSTSMGSVCASSLSLMDGGVPIKAPVAGIAMGLIYEDGKYVTLTDILGAEDAFGDMDFKVAGTAEFVTALQLDTKIDGLPADVLAAALQQARDARLKILEVMKGAIAEPRSEVGPTAPKMVSFEIPIDKIGEVIGPKGKVINAIQAETGADISVDDDGTVGTVSIGSSDSGAVAEAERQIKLILNPPQAEVGQTYNGRVVNITKFGAFVNILPGRDGLVHISKMGGGKRIDKVEDVLDLGDVLEVRVDDVDPSGKVSLSPVTPLGGGDGDGGGGGNGSSGDASRAPRAEVATTSSPSRMPSTPRPASSSATSVPRPQAPVRAAAVVAVVATAVVAAVAVEVAAAAVTAVAGADRREASGPTFVTEPIRSTVLASGIRVVTERMPEVRSVTIGCYVAVGGRDEPEALERRLPLPRAPAVQGDRRPGRPRDRGVRRRTRRRDERLHGARAHRVLRAPAVVGDRLRRRPARRRRRPTCVPARRGRVRAPGDPRGAAAQRGRARRAGPHPLHGGPVPAAPPRPRGARHRRDDRGDGPRRHRRVPRRRTTGRPTWWWSRPATSTTTRWWRASRPVSRRARRRSIPRRGDPRTTSRSTASCCRGRPSRRT